MSADDRIDPGLHVSREVDDFTIARSRPGLTALSASVSDHDYEVRPPLSQCCAYAVHDWCGSVEAKACHVRCKREPGSAHCRKADYSNADTSARYDSVVSNPLDVPAVGVANVGAEDTKPCLPHPCAQRVDTPVEFVISEGRRRIPHSIVVVDDRAAVQQPGWSGALPHVTTVEQHYLALPAAFASCVVDRTSDMSRTTTPYASRIGPRFESAVKIIGADDAEKTRSRREPNPSRSVGAGGGARTSRDRWRRPSCDPPVRGGVVRSPELPLLTHLFDQ